MPRRKGVFALLLGVSLSSVAVAASPPGGFLPITYDTRFGTDAVTAAATGWFTFGLKPGCRRIWCDASKADDTGDGLSAATAKKTINAAWTVFTNGSWTTGDQLMLAGTGGRTYTDLATSTGWYNYAGFSATYPTAILCYDPASPADSTKYGKLFGSDRPLYIYPNPADYPDMLAGNTNAIIANGVDGTGLSGNFVVQGLIIDGQNASQMGAGATGRHDNVAWQNNQFKELELGHDCSGSVHGMGLAINVSKCSFYGMWNAINGNTSGLFNDTIDGLWVQDCVFAHCGWKMSSSRDDAFADGGPFYLGHSNYYTARCQNGHFDRNVYIDSASDGWGLRGDAAGTQLVSIDEPIVGALTGYSSDYTEKPLGSIVTIDDWTAFGGGDIAPNAIKGGNDLTRGEGVGGRNAKIGTRATNGVVFDNPKYGTSDNWMMSCQNFDPGQINQSIAVDKLRMHNFAAVAQANSYTNGNAAKVSVTWTNSLMDSLSAHDFEGGVGQFSIPNISGTGVRTWTGGDYPSPLTKAGVITAMGFANKAAMVNAMLEYPHLPWAQAILGLVFTGYGATPLYATASVPDISGLPTPTVVYATTLGDLTLSSLAFVRGVAKTVLATGCSTNFLLSSSDLPAGFTIMGRALIYDGAGSGAATPTIHILETNADGAGTHTTAFTLSIGAGVVGTTWAAATDWTLTNSSLTANRTGTAVFWGPLLASAAKASGTVIDTIDAIGSAAENAVGFAIASPPTTLGSDATGNDIGYHSTGAVTFGGSAVPGSPFASWTTGDVIKRVKSAGNVSFYKNNVLQVTVDTTSSDFGLGSVMVGAAYPAITTQHATGFQTTTDFSAF